jgi:hypothetical protein
MERYRKIKRKLPLKIYFRVPLRRGATRVETVIRRTIRRPSSCLKFNWNQSIHKFSFKQKPICAKLRDHRTSITGNFDSLKKSIRAFFAGGGSNRDLDLTFVTKAREPSAARWIRKLKSRVSWHSDGCRARNVPPRCCQFDFRLVLNMSTLLCYRATCARK